MRVRLVLLAGATLLALAGVEITLRQLSPLWRVYHPPICWRTDLFQRWDPYGYRLWPSRTMTHVHPPARPRRVTIVSDAQGFRTARDLHAADPRPRVVVLGDSMVFGVGVEEGERLTERLEAGDPGWRVDNMGMVGYGPDLMLRALEVEGLEPAPAVVVMVLFSHDLYRVAPEAQGVGFPVPRFVLEGDRLVTVPYPTPAPWQRLVLVQGLRYAWLRYTAATFPLNAALLDRFRALAGEHGFAPALVFAPPPRERFDDDRRRRFLAAYAAEHGVAFLDPTDVLRAGGADIFYLRDDSHWSPAGHAALAELLRPVVRRLLEPRPETSAPRG